MNKSKIAGIGHYVPANVVTNDDLAVLMDTSDEWIQERTGIQERRYGTKHEEFHFYILTNRIATLLLSKSNRTM